MTKILSQRIQNLSPESQVEVLQYVELLLKKGPKVVSDMPQRMTLDRFQEHKQTDFRKETTVPQEAIHYTIW